MAAVVAPGSINDNPPRHATEDDDDPSGRRLSRSAENILSGPLRKVPPARPVSPQLSSKLSQGFKGLFHRKQRDNDAGSTDSTPASTLERPPVSYAEDIQNLPERPRAFNRVLQQIRSRPNMKKMADSRTSSDKLQVTRTRSDGSDIEMIREEMNGRAKRNSRDADVRPGQEDSDAGDNASGTLYYGSDMDDADGTIVNDAQRREKLMENYARKIDKTKELMKVEQKVKDDNVAEYLKLAENADKQQIGRIKMVFEKKNQKSNATIANLQKKLEAYQKQYTEVAQYGVQGLKKPREVLQGMHQGLRGVKDNIKEGFSGFSGLIKHASPSPVLSAKRGTPSTEKRTAVVSKPKEIAKSFKSKFGSADNIDTMGIDVDNEGSKSKSTFFTATPPNQSGVSEDGSTSRTSESPGNGVLSQSREDMTQQFEHPLANTVNLLQENVRDMTANLVMIEQSLEDLQGQLQQQYLFFSQHLQEERYKSERLQEQLADWTELHQNAINNLQREVSATEERVEYQGQERLRDLQEHIENNGARVSKLEAGQRDQHLALEDYSNTSPRILLTKLANVAIAILAFIFVLVSTASNTIGPFLSTRGRFLCTFVCCIVGFYIWKERDFIEGIALKLGDQYQFLLDHRSQ